MKLSMIKLKLSWKRSNFRRSQKATHLAMADTAKVGTMKWLASTTNFSLLNKLNCDPNYEKFLPNKSSRQVFSGHYVPVMPTPLANPYLVSYSASMAAELGISEEECKSEGFLKFFSGDIEVVPGFKSWATPYALSIYGKEMYQNCPFNTGNGYGDGRAISVGEVVTPSGHRWELQLKGGGRTPFCRGGDGRAVLRSSVREFLASEAMFFLGVLTTRALSLVASKTEKVGRPWYTGTQRGLPDFDDPRLLSYPAQLRPLLIQQLSMAVREPDTMQLSTCAITCRTAPSFLRVGQVELFGRRARQRTGSARTEAEKELQLIVEHVMFREYPHLSPDSTTSTSKSSLPLQDRIIILLEEISQKIAHMTAEWIRVGYCQGNFNSDNCLVSGRTMDYGPFGFIEKFDPYWNMWLGGGEHFSFINQPTAGTKNFQSLIGAVEPLLDEEHAEKARAIGNKHEEVATNALMDVWAAKLGIPSEKWNSDCKNVIDRLLTLMEENQADYTLLWRQLSEVVEKFGKIDNFDSNTVQDDILLDPLKNCFYVEFNSVKKQEWAKILRDWLSLTLSLNSGKSGSEIASGMRDVSPKFIPREWMLVRAYTDADKGDTTVLKELQKLFENPYAKNLPGEYDQKNVREILS